VVGDAELNATLTQYILHQTHQVAHHPRICRKRP